jgi:NADH-quinone oxidoreductase subunit G
MRHELLDAGPVSRPCDVRRLSRNPKGRTCKTVQALRNVARMTTTTSEKKDSPAPSSASAPASTVQAAPPSDMVTLTIDGQKVTAKKGSLLVEAARSIKNEIPVFCYHDKLKPVGACRMCLVEIEKMPRLQTACTTPVAEGMVVKTKSEMATGGQNATIALLLANHPLDCPVCDKGGECPLQDNTFAHGVGVSKFEEEKRHKDKAFELSENIVLDRERCILCYRCVRFHEEVPGDRALAVIDRGSHGEIGLAPGEKYTSPFQGNVIDICPVGALTSRHYRFRSRPWDLKSTAGIAADDPTGSNVWIDTRDGRVLRLRPRENVDVNDAWIADATRWKSLPAERTERLAQPLVRKGGKLVAVPWFEGVRAAAALVRNHRTGVLATPALTNEAFGVLAEGGLGNTVHVWPRVAPRSPRGSLAGLSSSKSVVVVGVDPWSEIPMLALAIRRAVVPFTRDGISSGGGGKLVVVAAENGLARDSAAWLHASKTELTKTVADLCDALEGKGGSDAAKKAAALLTARPSSLVMGAGFASESENAALIDRLEKALGVLDEQGQCAGFAGAVDRYTNAEGARVILGDIAGQDAAGDGGVVGRAKAGTLDTVIVVGDVPHCAGFPVDGVGKARAVWLSAGLPRDAAAAVPDCVDVVLPLAHAYEQAGSFTSIDGRPQGFDAAGIPPSVPGAGAAERAKADWQALAMLVSELGHGVPQDLKGLRAVLSTKHAFAKIPLNRNKTRAELTVV